MRRRRPIVDGMKPCTRCGVVLPATPEHFTKAARGYGGLSSWCRPCLRAQWVERSERYKKSRAAAGFAPGGALPSDATPREIARLLARVRRGPDAECWPWLGNIDRQGYGAVNLRRISIRAHRAVYEAMVGPIPAGLVLDHLCRNPSCVNPHHLEPVTICENTLRGMNPPALNWRKEWCDRHSAPLVMLGQKGERGCRECKRERNRRSRAKRREAA